MPVFTIMVIENHKIKNGKSRSTIMKTTDRGKRFKKDIYLQMLFLQVIQEEYFMPKENVKPH